MKYKVKKKKRAAKGGARMRTPAHLEKNGTRARRKLQKQLVRETIMGLGNRTARVPDVCTKDALQATVQRHVSTSDVNNLETAPQNHNWRCREDAPNKAAPDRILRTDASLEHRRLSIP